MAKLELIDKIDEERQKFDGYFKDKEKAVNRIAIPNIREAKLKELSQQRVSQKIAIEKRKNLVPGIKLITVARVSFRR